MTIFEKIIKGEVPSDKIYEDDNVFVFLDINPKTKGHTLVIPKKPVKDIFELGEEEGNNLMQAIIKVSKAVKEGVGAEGVNVLSNNGEVAGQEVFHIHFHIIPRFDVNEFPRIPITSYKDDGEKTQILESIKSKLQG